VRLGGNHDEVTGESPNHTAGLEVCSSVTNNDEPKQLTGQTFSDISGALSDLASLPTITNYQGNNDGN
jgi:hypothetical protein